MKSLTMLGQQSRPLSASLGDIDTAIRKSFGTIQKFPNHSEHYGPFRLSFENCLSIESRADVKTDFGAPKPFCKRGDRISLRQCRDAKVALVKCLHAQKLSVLSQIDSLLLAASLH